LGGWAALRGRFARYLGRYAAFKAPAARSRFKVQSRFAGFKAPSARSKFKVQSRCARYQLSVICYLVFRFS
jgi:hypothetical protein